MGRVEDATQAIPVIRENVSDMREDVKEVRDENRSMRRAFYTLAVSIVGSSILLVIGLNQLFQ